MTNGARGALEQPPDEPGWWLASDGKWYPPELASTYVTSAVEGDSTVRSPAAVAEPWATPTCGDGRTPWYEQTWLVVLALWFCFPIGLVLMWRKPSWQRGLKVGITAAVAALFVGGGIANALSSDKSSSDAKSAPLVATTTTTPETPTTVHTTTTTRAPTTVPATVAPTTAPPVTQPPVTQPPVTQPPVTQPPVTQPPMRLPSVTQPPASNCTPGYDPCIPPGPDVDCAGGTGNGPRYVQGPVRVTGPDIYGLDRDGNGIGCQ
jgi:hypothetical protein